MVELLDDQIRAYARVTGSILTNSSKLQNRFFTCYGPRNAMETEIGSQFGTKGVSLVGWCRDVWRLLVRIVTNSSNWRLTTFDGPILWIKSYEKIVWSFPFSLSLQTKQLISTLLVHTRLASDCGALKALLFGKSRDRSGFTSVIFCGTSFTTWSKYTDPYVVPWWLVSPMEPEVEKCRQRCDVAFIWMVKR